MPNLVSKEVENAAIDKRPFYNHFCSFFAIYNNICHKTEVQTVILRCLMGPDLNWFKSYDTKRKTFDFRFFATTTICARKKRHTLYVAEKD